MAQTVFRRIDGSLLGWGLWRHLDPESPELRDRRPQDVFDGHARLTVVVIDDIAGALLAYQGPGEAEQPDVGRIGSREVEGACGRIPMQQPGGSHPSGGLLVTADHRYAVAAAGRIEIGVAAWPEEISRVGFRSAHVGEDEGSIEEDDEVSEIVVIVALVIAPPGDRRGQPSGAEGRDLLVLQPGIETARHLGRRIRRQPGEGFGLAQQPADMPVAPDR